MKCKLWEYVGKNVELIDIDNEKFTGREFILMMIR